MNEVMQAILNRRSVRKFNDKPIEREKLEQILQAAIYAPSGMNKQTWQFTALTNKEKISRLARLVEKLLDRKGYNFYDPAVLVLTTNDRESRWNREDNACALENMFLAAESMGIGSVWINQLQDIGDEEEVRAFLREIGIPDNHLVYGIAALGYTDEKTTLNSEKKGIIKIVD